MGRGRGGGGEGEGEREGICIEDHISWYVLGSPWISL